MPAEINYKKKYLELRSKYINDLDMAFRLGVEQGMQQAQQQQAQDAQEQMRQEKLQQQQIEAGGAAGEHAPKEEGEAPGEEPGMASPEAEANGSELDGHINQLESALGSAASPEVKKSLEAILSLRKAEKQALEMKKAERAIKGIAKALHKPAFKIGVQASSNLEDNSKKALSMQHKIVNDVMKAWNAEETKASNDINTILNIENLVKE